MSKQEEKWLRKKLKRVKLEDNVNVQKQPTEVPCRLLTVFNSTEGQHLFAKLDEMGQNIIRFYIYSFHFSITIF